ncbi:MAG: hypothetical protein ACJAVI_005513 [Candidatus Azotimanducaceae bacterium]|jgi:hypothetical protein
MQPIKLKENKMSILQKQADFGRTIFEINQNAIQESFRTQQENWQKYFELNSTFGKRLPEVTDISTFVELQREYGSTLWENTKEATQNQTEIMKSALTEAGEAVRKVFNTDAA